MRFAKGSLHLQSALVSTLPSAAFSTLRPYGLRFQHGAKRLAASLVTLSAVSQRAARSITSTNAVSPYPKTVILQKMSWAQCGRAVREPAQAVARGGDEV
jgi:hypothetical protein